MPGLFESSQVGKREDLADFISIVDAKNTPMVSMIPKGKNPSNTYAEWLVDNYADPSLDGVVDGSDVSDYENAAANRARMGVYLQITRRTGKVSTLAEEVSTVAGLSKGEYANAVAKKLVEHKRDIESLICSDQDTVQGTGAVAYKLRGLGEWIKATAQTVSPVPASFLTPSASIDTTATGSLTEEIVSDVLQSIWNTTGDFQSFDMVCGAELRHAFTGMTRYASGTDQYQSLRVYSAGVNDKKITTKIDVFEGDFGTIKLHPSHFLARDGAAAVQKARGYLVPFELAELRFAKNAQVKQLPDLGGGPRFMIESILALCVKNPLAFGKFAAAS